jgi:hypothetical protein
MLPEERRRNPVPLGMGGRQIFAALTVASWPAEYSAISRLPVSPGEKATAITAKETVCFPRASRSLS